jgi:transcriptional regulator with XRE-family HTH domain
MTSTLRSIRKHHGLRATDLARNAGISQGYLSHLERGRRRITQPTAERLAVALETTTDHILEACKNAETETHRIHSWVGDIRINRLPLVRAFAYHVAASGMALDPDNRQDVRDRLVEYVTKSIRHSLYVELLENTRATDELARKVTAILDHNTNPKPTQDHGTQ